MGPTDAVDPALESLCLLLSVAHTRGVRLNTAHDLMGALGLTLENREMWRGRGRYGVRNFRGVEALPAPGAKRKVRWKRLARRWKALG